MTKFSRGLRAVIFAVVAGWSSWAAGQNQTATLTPVTPSNDVPFSVQIDAAFMLPSGLQSFVVGTYRGKWLLLAGRINGLHGFNNSNTNFPPDTQNTTVFVVDPRAGTVATRVLTDPGSGLSRAQIDLLTVTGAQSFQSGNSLYMCGGYGFDTATASFTTKGALTAINVPGLIHWVTNPARGETATRYIRSIFDPMFRVSGGTMVEVSPLHALLVFGEEFEGAITASSTGTYTGQVRKFYIKDTARGLGFVPQDPLPAIPDPNFFRTDLNVVPSITHGREEFTAFSGVFTPGFGVWTAPVEIDPTGLPTMADPARSSTFKQGMNHFACPTLQLYSHKNDACYTVLMGGISYGFFQNNTFLTDAELPFINQVTTIKHDASGVYSQYLMDGEYPEIVSTGSNPGNPLLFGAGATFIPAEGLHPYRNGVLQLDMLERKPGKPVLVGYVVGGIQSTLPNTNTSSDTAASPYIFTVTVVPGTPLQ